jgi:hypothetical protein
VKRATLLLLTLGCQPSPATPSASPATQASLAPLAFDTARARGQLIGHWRVQEAPGQHSEWRVGPDTFERIINGQTRPGWLRVIEPGRLLIKDASGTTHLGYAQHQDQLWIGPGRGGVTLGDELVVAENGIVRIIGERCWWAPRKLGGGTSASYQAPRPITCTLTADQLRYTLPRRSRSGQDERQLQRIGGVLIGPELKTCERIR